MSQHGYLRRTFAIASICTGVQLAACSGGTSSGLPSMNSILPASTLRESASTSTSVPRAGGAALWILQGPGLEAEAMATSAEGIKFFSNPLRVVLYPVKANVPAPATWKTILWHKYASFAAFESDIANNTVPAGTKVVGYDDESWSFTPANEQSDPIGYTIKFAVLARAHGYKMISMPAEDIIAKRFPGVDKFTAFINFGMAKAVAPFVDYYHIQSQDLEQVPASYVDYTRKIVTQVHGTNPKVRITGGISTKSFGPLQVTSTADSIDLSIKASDQLISGYWLNIVGQTTPVADAALANLH